MDKFAENINTLITELIPYTWVLAVAALLITGVMFIIPSEETHKKATRALPFIIIGSIVAIGAVYIGKWLVEKIAF